MKKLFLALYFIYILTLANPSLAQTETAIPENFSYNEISREERELLKPSMVLVIVINESKNQLHQGSGFVVAPGYVMTSGQLLSKLPEGDRGRVIIANDKLAPTDANVERIELLKGEDIFIVDLGLLSFKSPNDLDLKPLVFNLDNTRLYRVFAWGYTQTYATTKDPYGCFKTLSCKKIPQVISNTGTISSIFMAGTFKGSQAEKKPLINHGANLDRGLFGGPLLNHSGEVVGMNFEKISSSPDEGKATTSLAQTSSVIVDFLRDCGVNPLIAGLPQPPVVKKPPTRLRDLGRFQVDVPAAWNILREGPDTLIISSKNNRTTMEMYLSENQGKSLRDLANAYSAKEGGGEVSKAKSVDVYSFDYKSGDQIGLCFVLNDPRNINRHFSLYIRGDLDEPEVSNVLNSLV
ncbi:MAG: trypsin-like peptidase domain-containing protein, partial [Deltaproteobacteria bacterium]|nr:trypsin-like peptidase domain-containing protein [Deltaproteobacteria bacterium]